jgi:hypothetical protein
MQISDGGSWKMFENLLVRQAFSLLNEECIIIFWLFDMSLPPAD